jgi:hypothetical protein
MGWWGLLAEDVAARYGQQRLRGSDYLRAKGRVGIEGCQMGFGRILGFFD